MISARYLLLELFGRIYGRIGRSAQDALYVCQAGENLVKFHFPDNHQIDVALCCLLFTGYRAIHKCDKYALRQWFQSSADDVENPNRLVHQRTHVRKDWTPVVDKELQARMAAWKRPETFIVTLLAEQDDCSVWLEKGVPSN